MINAKHIIFVGIGALAALTIYGAAATKKASADGGHHDRLARMEALMDEGGVKYRASFFRRSTKPRTQERIAGLEPAKSVTEVTAPVAKPDAKAEEAKKAAEKKAADEKKKKEDEAKKKKKKKKKKDGKTDESAPGSKDEAKNDDDKEKKNGDPTALSASGGTTVSPYMNPPAVNQTPQTVDEWIAYLTTSPSIDKMNKFIQLAQVGTVKAEVFYPVNEKLMTMEAPLPSYAVLAVGSVTSVTSFEMLADVANEATLPDKLKAQATAYMNLYARFEYVRYLGQAALSKDAVAANDAILMIQRSLQNAQAAGTAQNAAQPAASGAGSSTRSPAFSLAKVYELVYQDVLSASQSSTSPAVRQSAQTVAPQIASLITAIGGSTTTETTTPAVVADASAGTSR